jgi:hypothetical protein
MTSYASLNDFIRYQLGQIKDRALRAETARGAKRSALLTDIVRLADEALRCTRAPSIDAES